MTKTDFILNMITSNAHIFTNPGARKANIKDAIESAAGIYDEAKHQMEELELDELKPKVRSLHTPK